MAVLWKLRIVPSSPDLLDAVLRLPLMDITRAHSAVVGVTLSATALHPR